MASVLSVFPSWWSYLCLLVCVDTCVLCMSRWTSVLSAFPSWWSYLCLLVCVDTCVLLLSRWTMWESHNPSTWHLCCLLFLPGEAAYVCWCVLTCVCCVCPGGHLCCLFFLPGDATYVCRCVLIDTCVLLVSRWTTWESRAMTEWPSWLKNSTLWNWSVCLAVPSLCCVHCWSVSVRDQSGPQAQCVIRQWFVHWLWLEDVRLLCGLTQADVIFSHCEFCDLVRLLHVVFVINMLCGLTQANMMFSQYALVRLWSFTCGFCD